MLLVLFPGANHNVVPHVDLQPYTHILLQNEIQFSATLACLEGSSQGQKQIRIFNPSPLPDAAKAVQIPWKNIDWLLVNAHEGQGLLSSLATDGEERSLTELTPAWSDLPVPAQTARMLRALRMLPLLSCTHIVCTLGTLGVVALIRDVDADHTVGSEHGSYSDASRLADDDAPIYVPAAAVRGETRDSTGAGDCFTGYFVSGLMRIWDAGGRASRETYEGLLRECTRAAGMCVEKFGAMESMPRRGEVLGRCR
jgi:ribokinase